MLLHFLHSADNRRLYVFRVLNILGMLPKIKVKRVTEIERDVTTTNNGCHVYLRNRPKEQGGWNFAITYRHCSCTYGYSKPLPG